LKPRKTGGRMPKGVRPPTFFFCSLAKFNLTIDDATIHA